MRANAGDQRGAVLGLELVEARAVDDPGDHLAHVVGGAGVGGHHVVQLVRVGQRRLGGQHLPRPGRARAERGDDVADDAQRVRVVVGEVVGDAGDARVQVAAAQLLGRDDLAGGRLHQRRAAEEDRALVADDHGLVAHRRHVRAARGARAEHGGDLRDAAAGHRGLVVEDPAEVLAVGEDVVLLGQEGAAGVDEVDARQPVLQRHLLRAQVLLDRHRVVGAALDGGVVGDDHALAPGHPADAGDHPGAGASPSYMPCAASGESSRNGEAGSTSASTRSRGAACRARRAGAGPARRRRERPVASCRAGRRRAPCAPWRCGPKAVGRPAAQDRCVHLAQLRLAGVNILMLAPANAASTGDQRVSTHTHLVRVSRASVAPVRHWSAGRGASRGGGTPAMTTSELDPGGARARAPGPPGPRWCARHPWPVIVLWLVVLAGATVANGAVGGTYSDDFSLGPARSPGRAGTALSDHHVAGSTNASRLRLQHRGPAS